MYTKLLRIIIKGMRRMAGHCYDGNDGNGHCY